MCDARASDRPACLWVEVASLEASSLHGLKLVKFDPQTCTPFSEVANLQIEASRLNEEFWREPGSQWIRVDPHCKARTTEVEEAAMEMNRLRDRLVLPKRGNEAAVAQIDLVARRYIENLRSIA